MTKRRSVSHKSRTKQLGSYQLKIEPLEARRLLAGLQVSVFVDADGSRGFDPGTEVPAASRLVFVDLDASGTQEPGEPIAVTDEAGIAVFDDLDPGDYSIGLLTNPNSQRQTTAVSVAPVAAGESDVGGQLLASQDSGLLWTVDESGIAHPMDDSLAPVDLGGGLVASASEGVLATLIVDAANGQQRVWELNLETGQASQLALEVSGGSTIRQLIQTTPSTSQSQTLALLESEHGQTSIALFVTEDGTARLAEPQDLGATAVAASPAENLLASVSSISPSRSVVRLHSTSGADQFLSSLTLDGIARSIDFSADGTLLFVAYEGGGIDAIRQENRLLRRVAILADAEGPVSTGATDGRLLTGSRLAPGDVIVWDTDNWTQLGTSQTLSDSNVTSLQTDFYGDLAWATTQDGTYSIDLAIPDLLPVTVDNGEPAEAQFGVRITGQNTPPDVSRFGPQSVEEDTSDEVLLGDHQDIRDPNGDALWFTLVTPPQHGQLTSIAGGWSYQPNENYHGADQAVLRVHDGFDTVELAVQWDVAPVNDPPLDLYVQLPELSEGASLGASVGFISVVDVDQGAQYVVTSSDPRFTISNGQVLFTSGQLDFDSEPSIVLDILATDVDNPAYQISVQTVLQLTNVDEPPRGINLSAESIAENDTGAVVGSILVDDPDADEDYEFSISDERFEIRDGQLRLIDGEYLDYESEDLIQLTITARERDGGEDADEITQEFSLAVSNQNDPPTGIQLSDLSLEGGRDGAVVGQISVEDPDGDEYDFSVSDERFEVVDGVLRLRSDTQVEYVADTTVPLTIIARSSNGDVATNGFPILLSPPLPPHQNPEQPTDVDGNGETTPLDVLILVNRINQHGSGPLPPGGTDGEPNNMHPDVDGDGSLTPRDVLMVINRLNGGISGEGEGGLAYDRVGQQSGYSAYDHEERRRRQNSDIDAELESLLEELSRHRHSHD